MAAKDTYPVMSPEDIVNKPIPEEAMPASRPSLKTLMWFCAFLLLVAAIVYYKTHQSV
jgi:hypothetical protein